MNGVGGSGSFLVLVRSYLTQSNSVLWIILAIDIVGMAAIIINTTNEYRFT
ncbi:MAG: hypothetical protein Athens071426_377 [Parcubacteria group bacterium Athens0714_26]|nr:MAG: hypothetical protein Athens071426_377 [Parcubacteria group bacterium Athens0714_26]